MKTVWIVGAGQLGSRHLQALRAVEIPLNIVVVDASEESLAVARTRYESVPGRSHDIRFLQSIPAEKSRVDLAIIATSSNVRADVVVRLSEGNDVQAIILEKILFDSRSAYIKIPELLKMKGVAAWVNCSMRVMPYYKKIKREFAEGPLHYQVSGGQFGLVTNAIHYIDHMAYLTGCRKYRMLNHNLDPQPIPSKRRGFYEFNGTIEVVFGDGSTGIFTCHADGSAPMLVEISNSQFRTIVRESEGKAWESRASAEWKWIEEDASIPFQSQMTTGLVEQILATGQCGLAPLDESVELHLPMLEALQSLVSAGKDNEKEFPFT